VRWLGKEKKLELQPLKVTSTLEAVLGTGTKTLIFLRLTRRTLREAQISQRILDCGCAMKAEPQLSQT